MGRVRELGELERALDATQAGTGATVLVAGEAGIGKTRLASELVRRARVAGLEVLVGRSIDLVGTELPYQPFVGALRPLGDPWRAVRRTPGSQLRVFEETLALLDDRAAFTPVLLVLEDLHWADTSTLDLVVFLSHNLEQPMDGRRDCVPGRRRDRASRRRPMQILEQSSTGVNAARSVAGPASPRTDAPRAARSAVDLPRPRATKGLDERLVRQVGAGEIDRTPDEHFEPTAGRPRTRRRAGSCRCPLPLRQGRSRRSPLASRRARARAPRARVRVRRTPRSREPHPGQHRAAPPRGRL